MNKNDVINMAVQSVMEAYEDAQETMSESDCIELLERVIDDLSSRLRCLDAADTAKPSKEKSYD